MLVGFVPSSTPGVNYSLWISSTAVDKSFYMTFYVDKQKIDINCNRTNGSYDYYVVVVNDNFENIKNDKFIVGQTKDLNFRGYITASKTEKPKFNEIYKRFYNTGVNNSIKREFLAVFINSYNPIISTFYHWYINTDGFNSSRGKRLFNTETENIYATSEDSYSSFIENKISIDRWKINTIGYDKTANLFYYSFSGYKYGAELYFNNYRYIKLFNEYIDSGIENIFVLGDYTQDSRSYTITSVDSSTYKNDDNSYLIKTNINDRNNTYELLSRKTNEYVKYQNADNEINFSSISNNLKNIKAEITKSDFLTSKMVSAYSETEIKNLVKQKLNLPTEYDVQIRNIVADDNTGTISFSLDILIPNNISTNQTNSKSVFSLDQVLSGGFKLDDLILSFKNDEAVNDIKQKYNLNSIIKTNNKGFIVENFLQDVTFLNEPIVVTEEMISLKKVNDTTLEITISIPIKDSIDGSGILPVGFSKDKAIKQITYSNFTGKETPTFIDLPSESGLSSNNFFNFNQIEIAGIAVGSLIFITILITTIIFIAIKQIYKNKITKIKK
ncbi:MAG: hypothetical protein K2O21_01845 [Malacoplasma sp.]|nr:hypothetical protein [Malacoplasma sp.]